MMYTPLGAYFFGFSSTFRRVSGDRERASVWFDLLLCELASAQSNADTKSIGEKVKHLIHSNPELFLSNDEIANQVGVSVKTVESKFKAAFGTTIHRYMLKFKIDQAISYMDNFPEMQMKEIAYNLGFYDEYHFSKQFKRLMGISPSCYTTGKQEEP